MTVWVLLVDADGTLHSRPDTVAGVYMSEERAHERGKAYGAYDYCVMKAELE